MIRKGQAKTGDLIDRHRKVRLASHIPLAVMTEKICSMNDMVDEVKV